MYVPDIIAVHFIYDFSQFGWGSAIVHGLAVNITERVGGTAGQTAIASGLATENDEPITRVFIMPQGIGAFCYDSIGTPDKVYPFLLANSGVIDILGNPRPEVWLNKAAYGLSKAPYIGVEPVTHAEENHTISAW